MVGENKALIGLSQKHTDQPKSNNLQELRRKTL